MTENSRRVDLNTKKAQFLHRIAMTKQYAQTLHMLCLIVENMIST